MRCIGCGCTELRSCHGGCSWVSVQPAKCSACFDLDGEALDSQAYVTGAPEGGAFGIEYCPAADAPAPHVPIYASQMACYCARCRVELPT